jgi:hypothetical protein
LKFWSVFLMGVFQLPSVRNLVYQKTSVWQSVELFLQRSVTTGIVLPTSIPLPWRYSLNNQVNDFIFRIKHLNLWKWRWRMILTQTLIERSWNRVCWRACWFVLKNVWISDVKTSLHIHKINLIKTAKN